MINWPESVISDIARRRAILFLGAGVSKNAVGKGGQRPPSWNEFLSAAFAKCPSPKKHINKIINKGDLLTACEIIKDKLDDEWNPFLQEQFVAPAFSHSTLHESLFRLDVRLILTQNFDKIYDTYAQQTSHNQVQVKNYYDADVSRVLRGDNRAIIKVHGTIDTPDKMIFTRREYAKARAKHSDFYSILDALTITYTFIFVGCSFNDPDMQMFLEKYANTHSYSSPHYIIMPKGVHRDILASVQRNLNLSALEYSPSNDHQELSDSITQLVDLVEAKRVELAEFQTW